MECNSIQHTSSDKNVVAKNAAPDSINRSNNYGIRPQTREISASKNSKKYLFFPNQSWLSINRDKKAKIRSGFEKIQPDPPKLWQFINRL